MILTIAISIGKFLAIWTLASIIAAFVLARFFHAANQGQRDGQIKLNAVEDSAYLAAALKYLGRRA